MKRKSEDLSGIPPTTKKIFSTGPYRGFHSCRKGEREAMEDAFVLLDDVAAEPSFCDEIRSAAFYAIYDGHCGSRAAEFAAVRLHGELLRRLPRGPSQAAVEAQLRRWVVEAYKAVDEDFLKEAAKAKPVWKDGTTATTLLFLNRTLTIANVGDSKAVLCRWKGAESKELAIPLTKDHNPQNYEERMRIQKVGGTVTDGRVLGQLEVSRSLGDGQYKNHGVIATPDLRKTTLGPDDRYVLMACDGLWKAFKSQEAIDFVSAEREKLRVQFKDLPETSETAKEPNPDPIEARVWSGVVDALSAEAVRRGCEDNVSVLIITLHFQR